MYKNTREKLSFEIRYCKAGSCSFLTIDVNILHSWNRVRENNEWTNLAQDMIHPLFFVQRVMKFRVAWKVKIFGTPEEVFGS